MFYAVLAYERTIFVPWLWLISSADAGIVAAGWAVKWPTTNDGEGAVVQCMRCGSEQTRKDGQTRLGGQRWRCNDCGRRFTARSTRAFSHHGFPDDVIALAVRWYVRYRLSYADVVEWLAERGLIVDRSTVYRWVQRFLPLFGEVARAHRRPVGVK